MTRIKANHLLLSYELSLSFIEIVKNTNTLFIYSPE